MKLTYRQKVFLSKVLDIYHELQEPVHYSVIAEHLGLNNSTAYDMLRLLEKKGMVNSEYATPKQTSGPGRASILFYPAAEALEIFTHLAGDIREQDDWEDVKSRILLNISRSEVDDYPDVLKNLLTTGMPEAKSSLVRCAEIITVLLLNLRELKQEMMEQKTVDSLLQAPTSKLRMSILAGLILGLSYADEEAQLLLDIYQEYVEKYQVLLQDLGGDSLTELHLFTRDVWDILKAPAQ